MPNDDADKRVHRHRHRRRQHSGRDSSEVDDDERGASPRDNAAAKDDDRRKRRRKSHHRHHSRHRRRTPSSSASQHESHAEARAARSAQHPTSPTSSAASTSSAESPMPRDSVRVSIPPHDDAHTSWDSAKTVVRGLLEAAPTLGAELGGLFAMLDAGEALVLDGIDDPLVKTGLQALCVALGMEEAVVDGATAYSAPNALRAASIVAHLGPLLPVDAAAARPESPGPRVIGPQRPMPDGSAAPDDVTGPGGNDSDGEDVGPFLPGDPRAHAAAAAAAAAADAATSAAAAAAAKIARRPISREAALEAQSRAGGRDEWMMMPPAELGGKATPGTGGGDATTAAAGNTFATKVAPRAGIGWAYLAKSAVSTAAAASEAVGGATPSARGAVDAFNAERRPSSLTELHQQRVGGGAPARGGRGGAAGANAQPAARRPFDREKDLAIHRQVRDPAAIIEKAAGLGNRFSSGTFERSFL